MADPYRAFRQLERLIPNHDNPPDRIIEMTNHTARELPPPLTIAQRNALQDNFARDMGGTRFVAMCDYIEQLMRTYALAALDAAQKPSTVTPTEPGAYWVQGPEDDEPLVGELAVYPHGAVYWFGVLQPFAPGTKFWRIEPPKD